MRGLFGAARPGRDCVPAAPVRLSDVVLPPLNFTISGGKHALHAALLLAVPTLVAAAESATCPFGEPTPWDHELSREEPSAVLDDKPGADIVHREAAASCGG
jgi:hypothetical protein